MEEKTGRVGIAISTRNRPDLLSQCIKAWRKYAPENSVIVVVDDNSDTINPQASYRTAQQLGIASVKNICIDLLLKMNCTDLFLSDDDVFPVDSLGIEKYIASGFNHMCMSFDHRADGKRISNEVFVKYMFPHHWVYNSPCGCLMYMKKEVVDKVGRYDENYGIWGMEHKDYSLRIHKAGLTPFPFIDIPESTKHFYSHDYNMTAESSVPEHVRIQEIKRNAEYFKTKHA